MLPLCNATCSDNPNPYFAQFAGSSLNRFAMLGKSIPHMREVLGWDAVKPLCCSYIYLFGYIFHDCREANQMIDALDWAVAGVCFGLGFVAVLMARIREGFPFFALSGVWLLALLAFGLTVPSEPLPYFQAGGALGWGVLVAAGLWLMGAFLGMRWHQAWGAILPLWAPILGLALLPNDFVYAVWGIGIATALFWILLGRAWHESETIALGVLSLSWASVLAFKADTPRWLAVCMAGCAILTLLVVAWRGRKGLVSWWLPYALLFAGFTATAVGYRLSGSESPWLELVLITLVGATLARGFASSEEWGRYSVLVWVAVLLASFGVMKGYGMALSALMVSLYALVMAQGSLMRTEPQERALYTAGAFLLTMMVGLRLFVLTYPLRPPRADLYQPFTLFGFLLALVGLGVLALWWSQRREESPLWRTLTAGFWSAGAPLALVALMTERAGAGWTAGALGAALSAYLYGNPLQRWVYPLAMAGLVVLLPLAQVAAPLAESPRATRITAGAILAGLILLTALVSAWLSRKEATAPGQSP